MRITPIAGAEPTVKQQYSFRRSTVTMLESYREAYRKQFGVSVPMKDLIEQMLLDFMRDDKSFQQALKGKSSAPEASPATSTPAAPAPAPAVTTGSSFFSTNVVKPAGQSPADPAE